MSQVMRWLLVAFLAALLEMSAIWAWLTYSYSVVILIGLTAGIAVLLVTSLSFALSLIWRARKVGYRSS
jgi:hypothetical protein